MSSSNINKKEYMDEQDYIVNNTEKYIDDILLGQPQFIFETPPAIWTGPLYYKLGDHRRVVWLSLFLIVSGVALYLIDQSITAPVLMGLLALVVFIYAKQDPPLAEFAITPTQVRANNRTYGYNDINSFWIDYFPHMDVYELSLHLKEWHKPHLKIPLQAQDPSHIRSILLQFIPEEEHKHTWPEMLMRHFGL